MVNAATAEPPVGSSRIYVLATTIRSSAERNSDLYVLGDRMAVRHRPAPSKDVEGPSDGADYAIHMLASAPAVSPSVHSSAEPAGRLTPMAIDRCTCPNTSMRHATVGSRNTAGSWPSISAVLSYPKRTCIIATPTGWTTGLRTLNCGQLASRRAVGSRTRSRGQSSSWANMDMRRGRHAL